MELINLRVNLFRQCLIETYIKWFGWVVGFVVLSYAGNNRYPNNNVDIYIGFKNGLYLFNFEVFVGRGYADHFEIGILNNYIFVFYEG